MRSSEFIFHVITRMEIACEWAGRGRFRAREIEHVKVASRYEHSLDLV